MRRAALALCAAVIGCAPAAAPAQAAPDPVVSAYQAYVAARDRGDLAEAETAAARALQASESRDGDGGSTAVLALNLAIARIDAKHPAEAIPPAARAVELARKGARGIDELQARLVLGEAQLAADPKADEGPVMAALKAAETRADLDVAAYQAAVALSKAAIDTRQPENLLVAWRAVATHAGATGEQAELIRARALTQQAVALMALRKFREAETSILAAGQLLTKYAPEQPDPDKITVGEYYYAEARAVALSLTALQGQMGGSRAYEAAWTKLERPQLPGRPRLCEGRLRADPAPDYPRRALMLGEVGGAMLRFRIDEAGKVLGVRVVSKMISADFRRALEDPRIKWTFEVDRRKSQPGCRVASNDLLVGVVFSLASWNSDLP